MGTGEGAVTEAMLVGLRSGCASPVDHEVLAKAKVQTRRHFNRDQKFLAGPRRVTPNHVLAGVECGEDAAAPSVVNGLVSTLIVSHSPIQASLPS